MSHVECVEGKVQPHGSFADQNVQDAYSPVKAGDGEVGQDPVKMARAWPNDSVRSQKMKQGICFIPIPAAFQQFQALTGRRG